MVRVVVRGGSGWFGLWFAVVRGGSGCGSRWFGVVRVVVRGGSGGGSGWFGLWFGVVRVVVRGGSGWFGLWFAEARGGSGSPVSASDCRLPGFRPEMHSNASFCAICTAGNLFCAILHLFVRFWFFFL